MCIAFVLAGCEVDTGPHRVATLRHPGLALVMPAPYDVRYILYRLVRFPPGLTTHDYVDATHLQHGEALGFRHRAQGMVAVAGSTEISLLPSGNYDWVMQADAHQIDCPRTVIMIASAVLVGAGIVAIACKAWRDAFTGK